MYVRKIFLPLVLLALALVVPSTAQGEVSINQFPSGLFDNGQRILSGSPVSFQFADRDPAATTYECQLDGGGWSACTSPASYSGLAEVDHKFEVRSVATATTDSFSWVTDTTPPTVSFSSGPPALTNSKSATINFTWNDLHKENGYVQCSIDAGLWFKCTSDFQAVYNNLSEGSHTLAVAATDTAFNTGVGYYSWIIDSVPPNTGFVSHMPTLNTAATSASFGFVAYDTGADQILECSVDGAPYSSCTSPVNLTNLTAGSHTFAARAHDKAGNVDPTPASYTWTVNPVPGGPDTTINSGPSGEITTNQATFTFSSTESPVHLVCWLDSQASENCSSPKTFSNLSPGQHTFTVAYVDVNNDQVFDETPATRTFTVVPPPPDTTAPTVSLDGKPAATTTDTNATFNFSANETATFECRLGGGEFAACTSPKNYNDLTPATRTFEVRATDTAGNVSEPVSWTWTVNAGTTPTPSKAAIGKVTVSGPGKVKKGATATYKVGVTNSGAATATGVAVKASGPGVAASASVGTIGALSTRTANVTVKPTRTGSVKITFKVTSGNAGTKTVTKTITVTR